MDIQNGIFYAFQENGTLSANLLLQIPHADRIYLHDFDLGADSTVVACGVAFSGSGQPGAFIARFAPDGQELKLIQTNPYWPWMISLAPDGSIWTVGNEQFPGADGGPGVVNPAANAVRHYSSTGVLIGSTEPQAKTSALRTHSGYLKTTGDRIGWYSPENGPGVYVEFSPDLKQESTYPGIPSRDFDVQVNGLALTDSANAFAAANTALIDKARPTATLFRLDRPSKLWVPVPLGQDAPKNLELWGSRGDSLIFRGPVKSALPTLVAPPR
jgi:hypothetical protein